MLEKQKLQAVRALCSNNFKALSLHRVYLFMRNYVTILAQSSISPYRSKEAFARMRLNL